MEVNITKRVPCCVTPKVGPTFFTVHICTLNSKIKYDGTHWDYCGLIGCVSRVLAPGLVEMKSPLFALNYPRSTPIGSALWLMSSGGFRNRWSDEFRRHQPHFVDVFPDDCLRAMSIV
jgi:hypothetical protein